MIRRFAEPDRAQWLRLRLQLWPDCGGDSAELLRDYTDGRNGKALLVAERDDGSVCGFVELSLHEYSSGCETSPVGFVEGWFVADDMRRRGVGRALLAAGEAWARALGCREMASDTEIANLGSQRAHAAAGYAEVERVVVFRKWLG